MEQKFNPREWLEKATPFTVNPCVKEAPVPATAGQREEIEQIIADIETLKVDIAPEYRQWRNIGFAFADAFGEEGRKLYHRVSRFYPGYTESECNEQFDKCLRSKGSGVTLKTFFWLAKNAGIDIGGGTEETEAEEPPVPTFQDCQLCQLCQFCQRVISVAESPEERDLMLLGSLVAMSSCLPNVYGTYGGRKIYPNMFLFISAKASAGKGKLQHCRQLVEPIHKALREEANMLKKQYKQEMAEFNSKKGKKNPGERPQRPPELMLFLPANSSTTGIIQLLYENRGRGLIFETEADTLTQVFKSDFGDYSDAFRKAFQHEHISYFRRTDQEYVEIPNPRLSAVLSGTPSQIRKLIPNTEDGLFSRFMFYHLNFRYEWKDVFAWSDQEGLEEHFDALGREFHGLYQQLMSHPEIYFKLTPVQKRRFNHFFRQLQNEYLTIQEEDYLASIRRLGMVAFRICMVLSVLRAAEEGTIGTTLECDDRDFDIALSMTRVLVKHASRIFSGLPADERPRARKNLKERFLDELPVSFNRQNYLDVARRIGINENTADRYIGKFVRNGLIHREKMDHYEKPKAENPENQEQKDAGDNTDKTDKTDKMDEEEKNGISDTT